MKNCSAVLAFVLLSASLCTSIHAQEPGALTGLRRFNAFAEVSAARTGQGFGTLWGASAGTYLQSGLLGVVLRGTALPGKSGPHIYSAVLGPRVAFSLPILRVFAEAGGGMGHAGYYDNAGFFDYAWAPAWQVDAGLSHSLLPHLDWRVVEFSYSRIYAGPGVSPAMVATGLSFHL